MPQISIGEFAKIIGKPLYDYQIEAGDTILDSVLEGKGLQFTVMFARQMGKNELSAMIEAYLLFCMPSGNIVKAAPTFKPQIVNSRLRLLSMLEHPLLANRTWRSYGYMIGVAPTPEDRNAQIGPRIMFFSAGPEANIVGATASLLLEIDEAQDVSIEKYDRDLRPMASTQNSTTVLYGTAWSDDTLLATSKENNITFEQQDGLRRHFQFDWRTLAAINPNYGKFVKTEIDRLGEDHVSIRTQYNLLTISDAGFLLNEVQRHLLRGKHYWENEPDEDAIYIAGMDVGGESRPKPGEGNRHNKRDSTIITIAKVSSNDLMLPTLEIIHQVQWTGKPYMQQYNEAIALSEIWQFRKIVVDRTGLGEVMASLLEAKLGERVTAFHFTRPSKSKLTYQFLSLINSGRLKMYQQDGAPSEIFAEAWKQLKLARYRIPGQDLMDMYVAQEDGHDDYLMSIALCGEAIKDWSAPVYEAGIVRPKRLYENESRY